MKPELVIGLGNPLMGDDCVGHIVAERLADDPRLPEGVEVLCGGTDLLRCAGQMAGRRRVIVIDALQDGGEPGEIVAVKQADVELDPHQAHAHHLSAVQAMRLLDMNSPTPFLLLGVSIPSAAFGRRTIGRHHCPPAGDPEACAPGVGRRVVR